MYCHQYERNTGHNQTSRKQQTEHEKIRFKKQKSFIQNEQVKKIKPVKKLKQKDEEKEE